MFDIGFAELLLISLIALIVIGPKRLPETARFLGYWLGKLRRTIGRARHEMEREFGIDEIKREVHNTLLLEQLDQERRQVEEQFGQVGDRTGAERPDTEPNADSWHQVGEDITDDELITDKDADQPADSTPKPSLNSAASDQAGEPGTASNEASK